MDKLAMMALKRLGNTAQSNPEEFERYAKMAAKFASNPAVQEKAFAYGKKGLNFAKSNPSLFGLPNSMHNSSSLEQRVSALEAAVFQRGGKTRKQKRKQRKTRKH